MNIVTPRLDTPQTGAGVLGLDGLHWQNDGYASFSGELLRRFRDIDGLFADWATWLGATEYQFPSMISLYKLQPVRYLQSFPHLATMATTFRRDHDTLSACTDISGPS